MLQQSYMISIMEIQTVLIAIWLYSLKQQIIDTKINCSLEQQKTLNSCKNCSQWNPSPVEVNLGLNFFIDIKMKFS